MQCQYITQRGQCSNEVEPGQKFCSEHSARSTQALTNQYRVACKLLGDGPERHAQIDSLKSLRGEIALLRSLIESRMNMIESQAELVAAMPMLKDSFIAVEKLVTACHNMDVKLSNLLDKQTLISLAQDIIKIIDTEVRKVARDDINVDMLIEDIGQQIVTTIAQKE